MDIPINKSVSSVLNEYSNAFDSVLDQISECTAPVSESSFAQIQESRTKKLKQLLEKLTETDANLKFALKDLISHQIFQISIENLQKENSKEEQKFYNFAQTLQDIEAKINSEVNKQGSNLQFVLHDDKKNNNSTKKNYNEVKMKELISFAKAISKNNAAPLDFDESFTRHHQPPCPQPLQWQLSLLYPGVLADYREKKRAEKQQELQKEEPSPQIMEEETEHFDVFRNNQQKIEEEEQQNDSEIGFFPF